MPDIQSECCFMYHQYSHEWKQIFLLAEQTRFFFPRADNTLYNWRDRWYTYTTYRKFLRIYSDSRNFSWYPQFGKTGETHMVPWKWSFEVSRRSLFAISNFEIEMRGNIERAEVLMTGWSEHEARSTLEFDNNPECISSAEVLLCVIIEVWVIANLGGRVSK